MRLNSNGLKVRYLPVGSLKPNDKNPRAHDEAQIGQIAASIKEFGFNNPILTCKGRVVAGQGRLDAAKSMGIEKVPTIELRHLNPQQRRAYVIADNQIALNSSWDSQIFPFQIVELKGAGFDMASLGFNDRELQTYVDEAQGIKEGLTDDDQVPEKPKKAITKAGDVWKLGQHRLLCGDSTRKDDRAKLIGKMTEKLLCTDPPFNSLTAWNAVKGNASSRLDPSTWFENDNLNWDDYKIFLQKSFRGLNAHTAYVNCDFRVYPAMLESVSQAGFKLRHCIVWKKNVFGMGQRYRFQHEFVIYSCKETAPFYGGHDQSDVWDLNVDRQTDHSTPKPVALSQKAICNSTIRGEVVLGWKPSCSLPAFICV